MTSAGYDLSGRVALVTGAGVGIGRAVALALAGAGATIGIHYHASAREAEDTLQLIGGKGVLLPADLTVEEQATGIVDRLAKHSGRLDILVNNAGAPITRVKIEDCPTELWRAGFDVDITGALWVGRPAHSA